MKPIRNKTWIISDTHFGHRKIIEMCNRPFQNLEEMEKTIIKNWNNRIQDGHDVIIAGDFSLSTKERCEQICRQLHGNKLLIKGNHDSHSNQYYRDCGFDEVSKYPIILEEFWIVSHEPLYMDNSLPYFNIHGHIHNNPMFKSISSVNYCVSVERTDYKPVDFEVIKNKAIMEIERSD